MVPWSIGGEYIEGNKHGKISCDGIFLDFIDTVLEFLDQTMCITIVYTQRIVDSCQRAQFKKGSDGKNLPEVIDL